jgi:hypothetical protein
LITLQCADRWNQSLPAVIKQFADRVVVSRVEAPERNSDNWHHSILFLVSTQYTRLRLSRFRYTHRTSDHPRRFERAPSTSARNLVPNGTNFSPHVRERIEAIKGIDSERIEAIKGIDF